MKKLSMLFAAMLLAGGVAFTSCSDDDKPSTGPGSTLELTDADGAEITTVEIPANGGQARVYVKSDAAWEATLGEQDWCEATKGSTRVTLSAEANQTGEALTTTLTVTAGDLKKTVTVTQPSSGEPIYAASYDSFIGTWTMTASDGENDATYTVVISARADYDYVYSDGTVSYKAYTVKGWGASEIAQSHPTVAIFEPSEEDPNVGYAFLLGQDLGEVTTDVPQEDGGTAPVTAQFHFSPLCVNLADQSKTTVFIGDPMIFGMGFLSDQSTVAFTSMALQDTNGGKWGVIAAGYVYEKDANTVGLVDILQPLQMVKAGTSSASVSNLSNFSNGVKYANMAVSSYKTMHTSVKIAK